jgi:hypothetical protein
LGRWRSRRSADKDRAIPQALGCKQRTAAEIGNVHFAAGKGIEAELPVGDNEGVDQRPHLVERKDRAHELNKKLPRVYRRPHTLLKLSFYDNSTRRLTVEEAVRRHPESPRQ